MTYQRLETRKSRVLRGLQSLSRTGVFTIPKKSSSPLGSTDRRTAGWLTFDCRVEETRVYRSQGSWRRGWRGHAKRHTERRDREKQASNGIEAKAERRFEQTGDRERNRQCDILARYSMVELFRKRHPIDVTSNHCNFNYFSIDLRHLMERGWWILKINVTMTSVFLSSSAFFARIWKGIFDGSRGWFSSMVWLWNGGTGDCIESVVEVFHFDLMQC